MTQRGSAAGPGPSGWRCRWPATSSRTWPPSTGRACGRSSSAAPRSTPGRSSRCSSRAGTPWPRSARRAPNAPGRCGRPNAGRAGTWTTNRSSSRTRRPSTSGTGHRPRRGASRPGRPRRRGPGHGRPGRADRRAGRADHRGRDARHRAPRQAAPPPLDQAAAGRRAAAPPQGQHPDGRQDLHRPGRQDLPPVAVRHAHLPVLRPGDQRRHTRRPRQLRLHPAARDALHFAALFDRFIQNLRRFVGYDLQYFAAVEPQRRLAPHVHIAIRGTVSRAELREVIAATYHQVWWPSTDDRQVRRRPPAGLGRAHRHLPRPGHRRSAADLGSRRSTPSATTTSRCTWPGSATGSTPRACSPDPGTPAGASATSPST